MKRFRGRKKEDSGAGAPLWMVTYSDMVTLLLAFFVLLFSFSSVDARKFQQVIQSMHAALGVLAMDELPGSDTQMGAGASVDGDLQPLVDFDLPDLQQMALVEERLRQSLDQLGYGHRVTMTYEERGLVVRFDESILFDSGRDVLRVEALPILDLLIETLGDTPNQIRVEGHTDDVPIQTMRFRSNWELSTARATSVIHYFSDRPDALDSRRVSAAGYGEYRPIAVNDTAAGRQRNRRVDIVVLYVSESRREPR